MILSDILRQYYFSSLHLRNIYAISIIVTTQLSSYFGGTSCELLSKIIILVMRNNQWFAPLQLYQKPPYLIDLQGFLFSGVILGAKKGSVWLRLSKKFR